MMYCDMIVDRDKVSEILNEKFAQGYEILMMTPETREDRSEFTSFVAVTDYHIVFVKRGCC